MWTCRSGAAQQSPLHMRAGQPLQWETDDASQHKQMTFSKRGSHVETAERQDQAGPGESPVVRESLLPGKQSELYRKFLRKHISQAQLKTCWPNTSPLRA